MALPTSRPLSRRLGRGLAVPALAIAAFGVVACSNGQESTDQKGTTPPVWTGAQAAEGSAEPSEGSGATEDSITTQLKDPGGKEVGTATFTKEGDHLQLKVEAQGLKPGFHGLHVHQAGKCEANSVAPSGGAPGNFLSAGGHFQKDGRTEHPASGDLTSLQVRADGSADLLTTTDSVTIDDLKAGRALIIHAGPDNFANIPTRYTLPDGAPVPDQETLSTGDAGGRVACGVLK